MTKHVTKQIRPGGLLHRAVKIQQTQVRVDLHRGFDLGVACELLRGARVHASLGKPRDEGVAQRVEVDAPARVVFRVEDLARLFVALTALIERPALDQGQPRGDEVALECAQRRERRAREDEVAPHRVLRTMRLQPDDEILAQRHTLQLARLGRGGRHRDPASLEVEVAPAAALELSLAQPRAGGKVVEQCPGGSERLQAGFFDRRHPAGRTLRSRILKRPALRSFQQAGQLVRIERPPHVAPIGRLVERAEPLERIGRNALGLRQPTAELTQGLVATVHGARGEAREAFLLQPTARLHLIEVREPSRLRCVYELLEAARAIGDVLSAEVSGPKRGFEVRHVLGKRTLLLLLPRIDQSGSLALGMTDDLARTLFGCALVAAAGRLAQTRTVDRR